MIRNYMVNKIFIDTGAFIAINDKADQYHTIAVEFLNELISKGNYHLSTSNFVVSETYTRILYRCNPATAIKFLDIINRINIKLIYSDKNTEESCVKDFLKKYKNEKISYVDAVSFQIMKDNNITDAFTFDKHFRIAGFNSLPL